MYMNIHISIYIKIYVNIYIYKYKSIRKLGSVALDVFVNVFYIVSIPGGTFFNRLRRRFVLRSLCSTRGLRDYVNKNAVSVSRSTKYIYICIYM